MISTNETSRTLSKKLQKSPTGIQGLDEITTGGLPQGRSTLLCGGPGCGKSTLAVEFLVRGAIQFAEPGVLISFEETADELTTNFASLGFDLAELSRSKKLYLDCIHIDPADFAEAGEYDLEGLFVRLAHAINSIGAKRVVLDTIEALFSGFSNQFILRSELRRLFRWLKDKGVTAVITAERGDNTLTRFGLEEYISDCVILLDNRVEDHLSTRRLRVVKYRGSSHGANEYPFLISDQGVYVVPITSVGLDYEVLDEHISTGVDGLDDMMGGEGYFRGSTVLVSGSTGTGKSSFAAHFANVTCRHGERCLYFTFEESPNQIIRNMRSIGLDLERWVKQGLLQFHATRPTLHGLEDHLVTLYKLINDFEPAVVVVDPITSLINVGATNDVKVTLMRLIDFLKMKQITTMLLSLIHGGHSAEQTEVEVSSLTDTWVLLRELENNGERNRTLYIMKSRGTAHSHQIREFQLTDQGIRLVDVYIGPEGVLTGSARDMQQVKDKAESLARQHEIKRKKRELERKRTIVEAQVAALQAEFEAEKEEVERHIQEEKTREELSAKSRQMMAAHRQSSSKTAQEELSEG